MSEEKDNILDIDPEDLTVNKLKSILSANNVELPTGVVKKQVYVSLFKQLQSKLKKEESEKSKPDLRSSKKRKADIEEEEESVTTKKTKVAPKSPDSKSPKKSGYNLKSKRKSNPFQSAADEEEDNEVEEKLQKKKRHTMEKSVSAPAPTSPTKAPESSVATTKTSTTTTSVTTTSSYTPVSRPRAVEMPQSEPSVSTRRPRYSMGTPAISSGKEEISVSTTSSSVPRRPRHSLLETTTTEPVVIPQRRRPRHSVVGTTSGSVPEFTAPPSWASGRTPRRPVVDTSSTTTTIPSVRPRPSVRPSVRPIEERTEPVVEVQSGELKETTPAAYAFLIFTVLMWALTVGFITGIVQPPIRFCIDGENPSKHGCVPCPSEAKECTRWSVICEDDYYRRGAECLPREDIKYLAQQLVDYMDWYLKKQRGAYECEYINNYEITKEEMKEILAEEFGSTNFEPAWKQVDDILDKQKPHISTLRTYSSSEATYGLICSLKMKASEYKWHFLGFILLVIAALNILHIRKTSEEERVYAEAIAENVRDMLQQQRVNSMSLNGLVEPHIAVTHVRDALLKPPISKAKRDRVWKIVESIIASDTRIQEHAYMSHGEQQIVWEWTATTINQQALSPLASPKPPTTSSNVPTSPNQPTYPKLFGGLFSPK